MPYREYVACVDQDGRTYRSRPHPDRAAMERIAAEAGGWVELAVPAVDLEPALSRAS